MTRIRFTICLFLSFGFVSGQKYKTEKSEVSFFSDAPVEDISAENKKATSIFNASNGEIAFSIPIKEFRFAKSLMQEHFNERYMDSDKFPKATFVGKIEGYEKKTPGTQKVNASGKFTVHGVARSITVPGTIEKVGDKLVMKSKFAVKLDDHKIKIPKLMWQNIAEQVEVSLDFTYIPQ